MPLTEETFEVGSQTPRISEGWYIGLIKKVEKSETRAGDGMYVVEFDVPSKEEVGRVNKHTEYFSMGADKKNPNAPGYGKVRFGRLVGATGVPRDQHGRVDYTSLQGQQVGVLFTWGEREDKFGVLKLQSNIQEFRSPQELIDQNTKRVNEGKKAIL